MRPAWPDPRPYLRVCVCVCARYGVVSLPVVTLTRVRTRALLPSFSPLLSCLGPACVVFPSPSRSLARSHANAGTHRRRYASTTTRTRASRCRAQRARPRGQTHTREKAGICVVHSRRSVLFAIQALVHIYIYIRVLGSGGVHVGNANRATHTDRERYGVPSARVYTRTYSESTYARARARDSSPRRAAREYASGALSVYGAGARDCVWPVHKSVLAPLPPEPHSTSSYLSQPLPPSSTCRPGRHTCVCVPWSSV